MTRPDERRSAPRVSRKIPLSILDGGQELVTETHDISASGAYCTVRRAVPLMTKLQIQLDVPVSSKTIRVKCQGVVVRIDPLSDLPNSPSFNIAIFFNDMTEPDRAALKQYVQQHLA